MFFITPASILFDIYDVLQARQLRVGKIQIHVYSDVGTRPAMNNNCRFVEKMLNPADNNKRPNANAYRNLQLNPLCIDSWAANKTCLGQIYKVIFYSLADVSFPIPPRYLQHNVITEQCVTLLI